MIGISSKQLILLVSSFIALVAVAAVAVLKPPQTALEISVLQADDALLTGRPDTLQVEVVNKGTVAINPVFSVQWDHYPFVWSGPTALIEPGEHLRALLTTTNYEAMPPAAAGNSAMGTEERAIRSVPFVVRVNNAGDGRYWASAPFTTSLNPSPIVNPDFTMWNPANFSTHGEIPVGWDDYSSGGAGDATIARSDGGSGLLLSVQKSAQQPDWAQAAVERRFAVTACPVIHLELGQTPNFATSDGRDPVLGAGMEIFSADYPDRSVWVVGGAQSRRYTLDSGTVIWETSLSSSQDTVTANVREALSWLGADQAQWANVKLFLSVHRLAPQRNQTAEIKSIACAQS